jgi:predicted anti-sigma-YlaC factor YlaD
MNKHLSPREVVDALEEGLSPERGRHLDGCRRCREQLARVSETFEVVRGSGEVPEPSPLFWDHFQARVRERTEGVPMPEAGWRAWRWRALAVAAPGLLAAMVVVTLGRQAQPGLERIPTPAAPAAETPAALIADGSVGAPDWPEMLDLTADLAVEQLRVVAPVRGGAAESLLEDFTEDERAELVRLLKEAMGGGL